MHSNAASSRPSLGCQAAIASIGDVHKALWMNSGVLERGIFALLDKSEAEISHVCRFLIFPTFL
jgi:hypothetical protein